MNLMLTLKNYDQREKLSELIKLKSKKLEKFLHQNFKISWNVISENNLHYAEAVVTGFKGPATVAKAQSNNPYKVIDETVNKLLGQLRKKHSKANAHQSKLILDDL